MDEGKILLAYALQQLINGVTLGMIYGLIAVGYTMVYGIVGMINFAHGDIFMIGSFAALIAITALTALGLSWGPSAVILGMLIATGVAALYGRVIERIGYRPLRGSFRLAPLVSAIGLSITLQNFVQISQGAQPMSIPPIVSGGIDLLQRNGFVVQLSWMQIVIAGTTLGILSLFTGLITRTRLGRSMRACEQDLKMAALVGIDTDRTIGLAFMLGAALAAVAGSLFLLYYGVIDFYIGFVTGIKAFTAAVLGGIGSLPGAVLGGLAIGLIETFWSAYCSIEYKDIAAFSILIVTLIFLPTGLLGRAEVEKV